MYLLFEKKKKCMYFQGRFYFFKVKLNVLQSQDQLINLKERGMFDD